MIITCPNCGTHYDVAPNSIKPTGSMMRCARCGYAWQQSVIHSVEVREQQVTIPVPVAQPAIVQPAVAAPAPPPPPPEPELVFEPEPQPMPEPEPEPEPDPEPEPEPEPEPAPEPEAVDEDEPLSQDDLDNLFGDTDTEVAAISSMVDDNIDGDQAETITIEDDEDTAGEPIPESLTEPMVVEDDDDLPVGRPRFQQPQKEKKGNALVIVLVLLAISFLGAVAFALFAKEKVFALYPPAKQMYIDAGFYEPDPGEGLSPQNISPARDLRNGIEYLIVEGKIVNIVDKPIAVPPLRVSLTNPEGKVVASEVIELNKAELGPGESLPFKAEFENPPATARSMTVDFIKREDMTDGGANDAAQ